MEQSFYLSSPEMITSHYGEEYEKYYNAIVPPIFMNSLNVFEEIDDYYNAKVHDKHTYVYGRVQNPTVRILEDKVAALEHGVAAFAFASGMAAATTAVLSVVKTGDHIVSIRNAYGPLKTFVEKYCAEHLGTTLTYVQGNEVSDFEEAITDNTSLVILESPSSVVFSLQDIEAVCKIAHAHGAKVYIDNTFCTPIFSNPLDMGVDIVMHTTSKYMGGHSDLIGGVLMQFFVTLALCFVSGCLYPITFFPDAVQKLAKFLPTGIARMQIGNCILGCVSWETILPLLGFGCLFLGGAVLIRRFKVAGIRG